MKRTTACLACFFLAGLTDLFGAKTMAPERPKTDPTMKPEQSEYYSPIPPTVTAAAGAAPSDAIVLFDGTNADAWQSVDDGGPVKWKVADGALTVEPKTGYITTRRVFRDLQLHAEFREPAEVRGDSQGRGNSGIFFMGLYELQVLDGYNNPTYVNGQVGALYKQYPPLVNASRQPGQWQTYDCVWIAPRFAEDGQVRSPARLTVFHNGVLAQYNIPVKGPTTYIGVPKYVQHPDRLPLVLQEHHNPVSYRNIWVRELNLPDYSVDGTVPAPKNTPGSVLITVTAEGATLLGNKEVTAQELAKGLTALHRQAPQTPVVIQAAPGQSAQSAAAQSACERAGLTNTSTKLPE
jgi:hypothetical protein